MRIFCLGLFRLHKQGREPEVAWSVLQLPVHVHDRILRHIFVPRPFLVKEKNGINIIPDLTGLTEEFAREN